MPDALFDLTVRPPADNEERLDTMPFAITAGATGVRDLVALCTIERIATNTMTIVDNTELMGNIDRLDPGTSRTVHCDPQVYLDPGRIDVQQATVTLALEFVADGIAGRQSAAFTYEAARDAGEGLRWHLTHVTSSRSGSRDGTKP